MSTWNIVQRCTVSPGFFGNWFMASNLHEFDESRTLDTHTHFCVFKPIVCFSRFVCFHSKVFFLARMTDPQALFFTQRGAGICLYQLDPLGSVKTQNIVNISQLVFFFFCEEELKTVEEG